MKTRHSPCLLFAAGALLALSACGEDGSATECEENTDCEVGYFCVTGACVGAACPDESLPMCDVNGVRYDNDCYADAAHAEYELQPLCVGPEEDPARYGIFLNRCGADPDGTHEDSYIWQPVCGEDGRNYGNPCGAEAFDTTVAYEGECL